jgi:GH25 family lysozyme M1 (1,4-beta-N-acetylmuramidase)
MNYLIDMAFGTSLRSHIPDMMTHGLYGAIWRVGQGIYHAIDNLTDQLAVSNENNLPYGLYYAVHPWYSATRQVERFLSNFQGAQPKSIWLDFELHGDETPTQRDEVYHSAFDYCRQRVGAGIPVVANYSGAWFINAWCPAMKAWIGEAPYWNASYPELHPQTWAQFASQVNALPTPQYAGYPTVGMWQFAGSLIMPMVPHQVDYNRIDDPAMYRHLFQGGPAPIIPPPPEPITETYEVIVANLNVRAGPGTQWPVVYVLHAGERKTVVERAGNWGRFATGRWMNVGAAYCRRLT